MSRSLLFVLPLALLLAGCDSSDADEVGVETEGLSSEQVAVVDQMPDRDFGIDDLLLPNGRIASEFLAEWGYTADRPAPAGAIAAAAANEAGPQAQKNLVIALMSREAIHLTDRTRHMFEEQQPLDGAERPAQQGIGFVYGSKNYTQRSSPPQADAQGRRFDPPSCTGYLLHGVDASGFLSYLASAAGFNVNPQAFGAAQQSQPESWNNLFQQTGLDKIRVEELGITSPDALEPGDFISWRNQAGDVTHVAFVGMNADGEIAIFQSHGSRFGDCERNFGPERGPRQIDGRSEWFDGTLGTWRVNRIVTDISGEWRLFGRCAGQSVDAFEFDFTIETTDQVETEDVEGEGPGVDYNGEPMYVELAGSYTPATNSLYAQLTFTWDNFDPEKYFRIDEFTTRLDEDDTGYIPLTRVEQQPSPGCPAEVRLINLETAPPPPARPVTELQPEAGTFLP